MLEALKGINYNYKTLKRRDQQTLIRIKEWMESQTQLIIGSCYINSEIASQVAAEIGVRCGPSMIKKYVIKSFPSSLDRLVC
jgi:hypothetical protein